MKFVPVLLPYIVLYFCPVVVLTIPVYLAFGLSSGKLILNSQHFSLPARRNWIYTSEKSFVESIQCKWGARVFWGAACGITALSRFILPCCSLYPIIKWDDSLAGRMLLPALWWKRLQHISKRFSAVVLDSKWDFLQLAGNLQVQIIALYPHFKDLYLK